MFPKTFLLLFLACMASFSPAFSQPEIELVPFATNFNSPVDIAHAGDSRLFVVEQSGIIYVLDSLGNTLSTPFLSKSVTSGGERGLLGLVFDPDYAANGYFYIHYSQGTNSIISRMGVSAGNANEADPASEVVIMTVAQPFSNHNGGDLAFGPDGYLYIGLGDGGSGGDPGDRSQNPKELLGKMLRIDVSTLPYSIPIDNPFVGDTTTLDEIWALGLRNPWRWSFDRLTGDLWIGDVGQGAREEIHFTPAGSPGGLNYGWRCYEGNLPFNTNGCGPAGSYVFPLHDYPRNQGSSVTGGFVYRGERSPELEGIYFFGDYGSGRLWGILPPDSTNPGFPMVYELPVAIHQWSTFGEDSRGELYAASYGNGTIYRIDGLCAGVSIDPVIVQAGDTLSTAQGAAWQWYLEGNLIPDATDSTFVAMVSGNYTVTAVDEGGCSGSSAPLFVTLTALDAALAAGRRLHIAPNPARDRVEVSFESLQPERLELTLTDLSGRVLQRMPLDARPGTVKTTLHTAGLPAGTYLLLLKGESLQYAVRLVVE